MPSLFESEVGVTRWRRELVAGMRNWLVLGLVVVLFSISADFRRTFFTWSYLPNIFQQSARNIVLAVGMSFVILTGGIDLSVGSVLALSGVGLALSLSGQFPAWLAFVCAFPPAICAGWITFGTLAASARLPRAAGSACMFAGVDVVVGVIISKGLSGGVHVEGAILICISIGLACGLFNGLIVSVGNVPAFVVTLGMMSAARGLTLFATNGESVPALVPRFMILGEGAPLVLASLSVVVAGMLIIGKFTLGRYILAIGGSEQATRLSGVDVIKYKTVAYAASGLCAAIAAIMVTAMFGQASTNAASGAELDAIAAVVIGGASLSGGRGSIMGAMVGALTITVITAGLILVHVPDTLQQVVLGALIVATVFVDQIRRRA